MEHRYKTLKVCITITSDIYFDQRVQKIASSLQEKGYSVTVLSRRKNGASERAFPFLITSIKSFFKSGFFFYAEYNFRLYFKLLFKEFDIVYACDLDTLLPATLVAGMRNKKLVFDAHEYFEESIEIVDRPIVSGIWTRIAKFCIPKTNLRITVSESLATQLSEKYRLPFHLVRNVPELRAQEINEFRKKMIWYQGAINTGRGLETMIEIMEELPEYSLYMAGYGDLFEDLNRRVSELHLKSRVRFLGRLSYQEMSEFAKSAFVGIDLLDSRSLSYYYSLSNKSFDYMHSGLPCIQMNFPEYHKLHKEYQFGVLIDSVTKEDILRAIRTLEDPDFYKSCEYNSRQAARLYNWNKEKYVLFHLFEQL